MIWMIIELPAALTVSWVSVRNKQSIVILVTSLPGTIIGLRENLQDHHWFKGKSEPETPSNFMGKSMVKPVQIFPSTNAMIFSTSL